MSRLRPPTRYVRRALVVLISAVLLAACGGGESEDEQAARTRTVPAPQAADAAAFPVTIEHKFGTTEIPAEPKRVVTVGFNEHDFALALDVQPIGVREFVGGYEYETRPWAQEALAGSDPEIVGAAELDFEKIASLRPDLILGIYSFIDEGDYELLSEIAPTVAQSDEFEDGEVPPDEQLRSTGRALGREQQAERVVDQVAAKFARARAEHPEFEGKTAAITFVFDGEPFVLEPGDLRTQFFGSLGFEPPEKTGELSREQIRLLDQDVIVLVQDEGESDLRDTRLFERLDAVKEGRVISVELTSDFAGALGFNSPLSRPFLLDLAVPRLAAALDGDPATEVPEGR